MIYIHLHCIYLFYLACWNGTAAPDTCLSEGVCMGAPCDDGDSNTVSDQCDSVESDFGSTSWTSTSRTSGTCAYDSAGDMYWENAGPTTWKECLVLARQKSAMLATSYHTGYGGWTGHRVPGTDNVLVRVAHFPRCRSAKRKCALLAW